MKIKLAGDIISLRAVEATEFFVGASRGQNAFLTGQKSTNLQKIADFGRFFF